MERFLDTSVVVRYLVGDHEALLQAAREIIDSDERLVLTPVVLAETAYVLTSVYRLERAEVVDTLLDFLARKNIATDMDKALTADALYLCRGSHRVSFADAMLWLHARHLQDSVVLTFDRRFPDSGIRVSQSL